MQEPSWSVNAEPLRKVHEVVEELWSAWEASGATEKTRDDPLRVESNYFKHNVNSSAYAHYREQGWSTTSSEVER